jgi:hypothetical protein
MHAAMDLSLESIPGFPNANNQFFFAEMTEGFGTIVHDTSRIRATGTTYGSPVWSSYGSLGPCLTFASASSQYVQFGTNALWNLYGTSNMAWAFAIRIPSIPASVQVMWSKGLASTAGWYFRINTDGTVSLFISKSGGYTQCQTTYVLTPGYFSKFLFVYKYGASDTGTVDIYVNGELEKTVSSVVTMVSGSAYDMTIGKYSSGTAYYLDGSLQQFSLWNNLTTQVGADTAKAIYKYSQGFRGGQLIARAAMIGSVATTTGFIINDTGWWSYITVGSDLFNAHAFVLGSTATAWQQNTNSWASPINASFTIDVGDAIIGGYNYKVTATGDELGGIYFDQWDSSLSSAALHVRGALIASAFVPAGGYFEYNANIVFPDQGGSNFGIAFTDGSGDQIGVIGCDSTNWLSTGWDGMAIATLGIPSVNYDLIFCSRLGSDSYAEDGACYVFHSPYATTGTKEAFILPSIDSARDGTKIYGVHLGAQNYKFLGLWVRDGGKVEIGDATYPFVLNTWNGSTYDAVNAYIS